MAEVTVSGRNKCNRPSAYLNECIKRERKKKCIRMISSYWGIWEGLQVTCFSCTTGTRSFQRGSRLSKSSTLTLNCTYSGRITLHFIVPSDVTSSKVTIMSLSQMTGKKIKDSPTLPLLIRTNPFALKFALTKALHGNVLPRFSPHLIAFL